MFPGLLVYQVRDACLRDEGYRLRPCQGRALAVVEEQCLPPNRKTIESLLNFPGLASLPRVQIHAIGTPVDLHTRTRPTPATGIVRRCEVRKCRGERLDGVGGRPHVVDASGHLIAFAERGLNYLKLILCQLRQESLRQERERFERI